MSRNTKDKHQIASSHLDEQNSWNEKSFRYTEIDDSGDFYIPRYFAYQDKINKQSSVGLLEYSENLTAIAIYQYQCEASFTAYRMLIEMGVSREQARGVLPACVYTTWVWTVSLQALLNFISLRTDKGAQGEIAKYAIAIQDMIADIVPVTLEIWQDYHGSAVKAPDASKSQKSTSTPVLEFSSDELLSIDIVKEESDILRCQPIKTPYCLTITDIDNDHMLRSLPSQFSDRCELKPFVAGSKSREFIVKERSDFLRSLLDYCLGELIG